MIEWQNEIFHAPHPILSFQTIVRRLCVRNNFILAGVMGKKITLEQAFGAALKEARSHSNYSQEGLALESGYDRTFISLLERGLRTPSLETVFILANTLGTSPIKLLEDVVNRYGNQKPSRSGRSRTLLK